MSTERPYSKELKDRLRAAGYKQGKRGTGGYDIIKRDGAKIIEIHGKLFPKID